METDVLYRYQLAANIARAVRNHAPDLLIFHAIEEPALDDILADKVERAWLDQMMAS
jgi:hypothetical protein